MHPSDWVVACDSGTDGPWIDPALLPLVAEQRVANDEMREAGARMPAPGAVAPQVIRRGRLYRKDGGFRPSLDPAAYDTTVAGVLTRVFPAVGCDALTVHFHGGGWTFGSVYEQDGLLTALAAATGAPCITVDYPLAPESELPATLDVAEAALAALIEAHPDVPVSVIGESAGAHVALMSVLRLRARPGLFERVRALGLTYGIYDLSMTPSQKAWGSEFLGLSTDWLEYFYALALPGMSRDRRADPALSPLYADLAGLPPVLLGVGTLDPLLDDSVLLGERLRGVGNDVTLRVYPEAPHGFNHQRTAMAAAHNDAVAAFLMANR